MKTRYTVALSILAGVAVGAAAVQALHAQAKPPAYVVAEIDVTNLVQPSESYDSTGPWRYDGALSQDRFENQNRSRIACVVA